MSASARVRAHAARVVAQVAFEGQSLDKALAIALTSVDRDQDRGLLRALCYDSIRWYVRLDALLRTLLSKPSQRLDPEIHGLAIVGLCQLQQTDIPAHAAVMETVNAAKILRQPRASGLINALLRRYQREGVGLLESIDRDLALKTSHPRWLVKQLTCDWGAQAAAILEANNERPPFWIRVNTRRVSVEEYRTALAARGFAVAQVARYPEGLRLERAVDVNELPGFGEGLISVQDAAAQWAARLIDPAAGERILDACAAPGGKTCHLLELQPGIAELVAVDISSERTVRIQQNLERLGLTATLRVGNAAEPAQWWDGRRFDRILLDVPCSATGVIRRHPDVKLLRRPEDIAELARRQSQLLRAMWPLLNPGGRLVYASCSAFSAENSEVVGPFLRETSDAKDVTRAILGINDKDLTQEVGYRIAAGTDAMDGFYYACLQKDLR
ncbi:MAG TPA: 16S rRNA (cytosine(967)-C(5))-methyltransferase RsmB [Steroidobacteraceae bacterium]|nr:16S rRNA (cytosine(967)-C(5))-methyltransferase RsmB [Steroidobacteraceae bacterium]